MLSLYLLPFLFDGAQNSRARHPGESISNGGGQFLLTPGIPSPHIHPLLYVQLETSGSEGGVTSFYPLIYHHRTPTLFFLCIQLIVWDCDHFGQFIANWEYIVRSGANRSEIAHERLFNHHRRNRGFARCNRGVEPHEPVSKNKTQKAAYQASVGHWICYLNVTRLQNRINLRDNWAQSALHASESSTFNFEYIHRTKRQPW